MDLPNGWTYAKLCDLVSSTGVFCDGDWVESKDQDANGDIRLIQLADLGDGRFLDKSSRFLTKAKAELLRCTYLKKGDILVARMPDPLGRAIIFPLDDENRYVTVVDVAIIRPGNEYVLNKYCCYVINALPTRNTIAGLQSGTTRKRISRTKLETVAIPLPPLAEQHRIVAKIDVLFSKLDNGVETLQTIRRQLRTYRQAVLKWAFEGKEWEYKPFSMVAPSRLGKMLDKVKNTGTFHKYLRNVNVRWFGFDCSDLLEMKMEENEIEKYQVKKGDLLICEGGEPGRCAIWKSEQTIAFQKALHRVRPKDEIITEFLMYFISFITTTGAIKPFFTGTGIKHLTGESLNKIPVPVPSISEQEIIVAAIESRLSVCDKLEQIVDETLAKAAALRQSILKKAFAGKLVPQDPNDEPAEKLLERIKAAKTAAVPKAKSAKNVS